jgi:hypothetical protein
MAVSMFISHPVERRLVTEMPRTFNLLITLLCNETTLWSCSKLKLLRETRKERDGRKRRELNQEPPSNHRAVREKPTLRFKWSTAVCAGHI